MLFRPITSFAAVLLCSSLSSAFLMRMMRLTTTAAAFRPPGCSNLNHKSKRMLSRSVIRLFSSAVPAQEDDEQQQLIHPQDHFGKIPYPKALSPSKVMTFKQCPQAFLFQYLYNMTQPTTLAMVKGTMCHAALEQLFDLDPNDRTPDNLHNLLRRAWSQERHSDKYAPLFENEHDGSRDLDRETEWGKSALQLLDNYFQVEDPRAITRPNPLQREVWVNAHLTVDPSLGVTASGSRKERSINDKDAAPPTFHVRGIIDRLDMVRQPSSSGGGSSAVATRIVDYKTGKSPNLKYSPAMNQKIMEEAFYQLKVYALLLREKQGSSVVGQSSQSQSQSLDYRWLRLLHLTSASGKAQHLDFDLGATQEERDAALQEVHQDLSQVWNSIIELVDTQDPRAFVGCNRSFCSCHECRAQFVPGTVWEPSS